MTRGSSGHGGGGQGGVYGRIGHSVDTNNDRLLIYGAALLRGLAAGAISVLAAVYLAKRGFDEAALGVVLSAGMAGVLAGTIFGTYFADRIGRRSSLVTLALLAAVGARCWSRPRWWLRWSRFRHCQHAGPDRGAAQALEQAILPATTTDADRTQVFARYNAIADVGGAAGALLAALPALLRDRLQVPELPAYDATVLVYAALILIVAVLYARLSAHVESAPCLSAGRSRARCAAQHPTPGAEVCWVGGARCNRRWIHRIGANRLLLYARFGVTKRSSRCCSSWRDW